MGVLIRQSESEDAGDMESKSVEETFLMPETTVEVKTTILLRR